MIDHMWSRFFKAAGVGAAIAILLLLVLIVVAAFGPLPHYVIDHSSAARKLSAVDQAKAEADVRGSLLQAVGGILVVLGTITAWRQVVISRNQHVLGRHIALTETFAKALEQLGNKEVLAIRLGGIYSLDRIADEDSSEQSRIAEILSTFVREHANKSESLPQDAAAALAVLTRRDWPSGVDLAETCLMKARLRKARLLNAKLDHADLREANLADALLCDASLIAVDLRQADLSGADLSNAKVVNARLSGAISDQATRWPDGFRPGEHGILVR
jgi:hypothetical protein